MINPNLFVSSIRQIYTGTGLWSSTVYPWTLSAPWNFSS